MAVLLRLDQSETWLCMRALVSACAEAARAGELARHARLLSAMQLVARAEPFVATSRGVRWLQERIVEEGADRKDVAAVGGLLARLAGVGVSA